MDLFIPPSLQHLIVMLAAIGLAFGGGVMVGWSLRSKWFYDYGSCENPNHRNIEATTVLHTYKIRVFVGNTGKQEEYSVDGCYAASSALRKAAIKANEDGHTGPSQMCVIEIDGKASNNNVMHDVVLASSAWTRKDNLASFKQGWSIFLNDSTHYKIQKLDDPDQVNSEVDDPEGLMANYKYVGPLFDTDTKAVQYVKKMAEEFGDPTCRKAIEFLIMVKSPQVHLHRLAKTWD